MKHIDNIASRIERGEITEFIKCTQPIPIIDQVDCPMCKAPAGFCCLEEVSLTGPAPGSWCNEREWRWHYRHGNMEAAQWAKAASFRLSKAEMR